MRDSLRIFLVASVLAGIAGCATTRVSAPVVTQPSGPDENAERMAHWQFDPSRPPAESDGYRPPNVLAVLLPMTGELAVPAASVRDGLLAAYYGERRRRPELRFYDTFGTGGGASAAYAKAIAEGADQIVGPLGREEVNATLAAGQGNVPLLALNRGDTAIPRNAASFSLAPEDEGIGAANYLIDRKALRILVLSSGDDSARRSSSALAAQLQLHGGSVVQTLAVVGDSSTDMTGLLQGAAQAAGGIDGVFLALRGSQARPIAGQLIGAGLGAKPRVATSQLLSGTGKAEEDKALDGIAFPTERWGVTPVSSLPNAAMTGQTLPTARGPAAKLFAFGHDAWQVSAYLEHLALASDSSLLGATGTLRVGPEGNVIRMPAWSTFSGGYVVPLTTGSGG